MSGKTLCACAQAGVGFWLTDAGAVRAQAEALAKAQFAARRDPQDCALLYIALGRRALLQAGPTRTYQSLLFNPGLCRGHCACA